MIGGFEMIRTVSGFCSVQKKEYTIELEFLDVSALADSAKEEIPNRIISCNYANNNSDECDGRNCSIRNKYKQ